MKINVDALQGGKVQWTLGSGMFWSNYF